LLSIVFILVAVTLDSEWYSNEIKCA